MTEVETRPEHLEPGAAVFERRFQVTRSQLARYAVAAGDGNRIHLDDAAAHAVGLPGVVAHGMLTMAFAIEAVTEWVGDPDLVVSCSVRFARPLPVPEGVDGAELTVHGRVAELLDGGRIRVGLSVSGSGRPVLSRAEAVVRHAPAPEAMAPAPTGAASR